jgi:hypothetical protein
VFVYYSKIVPPPGVPLRHVFVVSVVFSRESIALIHGVIFGLYRSVLVYYYNTFCCFVLFVPCVLFIFSCLFVLLFLLWVIWMLARTLINNNWSEMNYLYKLKW